MLLSSGLLHPFMIVVGMPGIEVRPQHHRALPYAEVAGAIATVRRSGAYPAAVLAFEFLVLTACRGSEVRGARWEEIDFEAREWRIPPERMKTGREHRVPLSEGALAVLREVQALADGSSPRRGAGGSLTRRSRRWSGTSGSMRCRTDSGRLSGTGRRSAPRCRGKSASWRWPT